MIIIRFQFILCRKKKEILMSYREHISDNDTAKLYVKFLDQNNLKTR